MWQDRYLCRWVSCILSVAHCAGNLLWKVEQKTLTAFACAKVSVKGKRHWYKAVEQAAFVALSDNSAWIIRTNGDLFLQTGTCTPVGTAPPEWQTGCLYKIEAEALPLQPYNKRHSVLKKCRHSSTSGKNDHNNRIWPWSAFPHLSGTVGIFAIWQSRNYGEKPAVLLLEFPLSQPFTAH